MTTVVYHDPEVLNQFDSFKIDPVVKKYLRENKLKEIIACMEVKGYEGQFAIALVGLLSRETAKSMEIFQKLLLEPQCPKEMQEAALHNIINYADRILQDVIDDVFSKAFCQSTTYTKDHLKLIGRLVSHSDTTTKSMIAVLATTKKPSEVFMQLLQEEDLPETVYIHPDRKKDLTDSLISTILMPEHLGVTFYKNAARFIPESTDFFTAMALKELQKKSTVETDRNTFIARGKPYTYIERLIWANLDPTHVLNTYCDTPSLGHHIYNVAFPYKLTASCQLSKDILARADDPSMCPEVVLTAYEHETENKDHYRIHVARAYFQMNKFEQAYNILSQIEDKTGYESYLTGMVMNMLERKDSRPLFEKALLEPICQPYCQAYLAR